MRLLVTGAAGFIGSHLTERLLAGGHSVVGLDAFTPNYPRQLKESNLAAVRSHPGFRLHEGDIRDRASLRSVFAWGPFDAVVHLAALPGVTPSLADPVAYTDVNVLGTCALLQACREAGISRVVIASSSSVYGETARVPFTEEDPLLEPISPYGTSKRCTELLGQAFHRLGIEHVALLRLFTVYGPRQRPEMAIHRFTRLALSGEELPLYGSGSTERDYTFVSDIVEGMVRTLERSRGLQILNLGNSRPVSLEELTQALGRVIGEPLKVRVEAERAGDVKRTWADLGRSRAVLGFAPEVSLEEGLTRFVAWYRENRTLLEQKQAW